ncbi:MAG: hypothetical protein QOD89_2486, partial [Bradyrhizobium sp.]|nr:hypothetical protein [Bradyrhizobium sp.]
IVAVKDPAHPGVAFAQLADRITLWNWTDPLDRIEKLSFADGTTLSIADSSALAALRVPFGAALSRSSVAENAANGTVVGTVTGYDLDTDVRLHYALTDSAGGRFAINGVTGAITVANGLLLDYEASSSHSYEIRVRTADDAGYYVDKPFTIAVTDAVDPGVSSLFAGPDFKLAAFAPGAGGWNSDNLYPRQLADVNGDGMADIVGFGTGGAYVALATGGGTFGPISFMLAEFGEGGGWTNNNLYPRRLADVNGDGLADIVGFGTAGAYVALATGGGRFGPISFVLAEFGEGGGWTNNNLYPRELADVNGDGMADIVGFGAPGAYVALATGGGAFGPISFVLAAFGEGGGWTNNNLYPRQLADINGDGMADIVAFGDAAVYVALATGGGGFGSITAALSPFTPAGGWSSNGQFPREVADVSGDGKADIVGFGPGGVVVALGNGDGTFHPATADLQAFMSTPSGWTSNDAYPRHLADVNGDRVADIVGFGYAGVYDALSRAPEAAPRGAVLSSNTVAENSPTGTQIGTITGIDANAQAVLTYALADNAGGHFAINASSGVLTVASAIDYETMDSRHAYDITVRISDQAGHAINQGFSIAVSDVYEAPIPTSSVFAPQDFRLAEFGAGLGWTNDNLYPRRLADVNGDGMADIVGFGTWGVYTALATGGGAFGPRDFKLAEFGEASGWTNNSLYPRTLADVNGDGMADIVGFGQAGVYVALATGGGAFGPRDFKLAQFGAGTGWTNNEVYPRQLADVNGDGMADIVGFGGAGVYVALATGGGSFGPSLLGSTRFGADAGSGGWTSNDTYPRQLADVNGDGKADIVGFGETGVYVALATGGGAFGPASFFAGFAHGAGGWSSQDQFPRELADVNGDHKADIVGFGPDRVYLALGNGDGSFQPMTADLQAFAPGAGGWDSNDTYPRHLADINGDGAADIVGFGHAGVYDALSHFHLI